MRFAASAAGGRLLSPRIARIGRFIVFAWTAIGASTESKTIGTMRSLSSPMPPNPVQSSTLSGPAGLNGKDSRSGTVSRCVSGEWAIHRRFVRPTLWRLRMGQTQNAVLVMSSATLDSHPCSSAKSVVKKHGRQSLQPRPPLRRPPGLDVAGRAEAGLCFAKRSDADCQRSAIDILAVADRLDDQRPIDRAHALEYSVRTLAHALDIGCALQLPGSRRKRLERQALDTPVDLPRVLGWQLHQHFGGLGRDLNAQRHGAPGVGAVPPRRTGIRRFSAPV